MRFSQVCLKLALWFWRRRFLNFVNVFSRFCYYHSLEKDIVPHLYKLEFPLSWIICAKFGWNWPSGSLCFRYFVNISHWKTALPLNSNKLESILPFVSIFFAKWFLGRRWKCEKLRDGRTHRWAKIKLLYMWVLILDLIRNHI